MFFNKINISSTPIAFCKFNKWQIEIRRKLKTRNWTVNKNIDTDIKLYTV